MKTHWLHFRRKAAVLGFLAACLPAQESAAPFDAALVVADALSVPITDLLDLDGDGRMDAAGFETDIGTNTVNRKVALWSNDGSGRLQQFWATFDADTVHTTLPSRLAVGPLGAPDGRDDFVLAYGTVVRVHYSAGFATPVPAVTLSESATVRGLVVRDFDGDGRGDIGVLTDSYVRVWFHQSGATFSPVTLNQSFMGGPLLLAGEVNGDGNPDLAVVDGAVPGYVFLFPVVSGLVTPGATLLQDVSSPMPAIGDIDGDGDEDIVVFGWTSYRVHRRVGPTTFVLEPPATGGPATDLHDVDGDGDLDGACCSGGGGPYPPYNAANMVASIFRVSLNQGGGAFAPAFDIPGLGAQRLAGVADLDGDGDRDLVAGRAVVYARGPIMAPPHPAAAPFPLSEQDVLDAEGDGDPDAHFGIGAPYWSNLGAGAGVPAAAVELVPAPTGTAWAGPGYPGDWDGDGDPDLIVEWRAGQTFLSMRLLENRGGGLVDAGDAILVPGIQFSQYVTLDSRSCLPADTDGDGDLDLVMRSPSAGFAWSHIWNNNGSGRFTWGSSFDTEYAVAFADFTGDGRPDALTSDGGLKLKPGLAGGGFGSPQVLISAFGGATGIFDPWKDRAAIADWNADGLLDLFAYGRPGGFLAGGLVYFVNVGGALAAMHSSQTFPIFGTAVDSNLTGTGVRLHALDVNADGLTDLVVWPAYQAARGTGIHLRTGPGMYSFAPQRAQMLSHGSTAAVFADLDDDGDVDTLATGLVRNRTFELPAAGGKWQYASGFAGSGGLVPTLGARGPFRPGLPAQIRIRGGPGAAPGILVLGDQATYTPMLGAIEYVNWVGWTGVTLDGTPGAAGAGSWTLDVGPLPPSVAGLSVYMQAAIADPQGPMGLSRTNPIRVTVGN